MNAHRRCRRRTGSAALFSGLADPLADAIPIVGRNELSDGSRREVRALPPNDLGCCLPLGVPFACLLHLRGVVLPGPQRLADELLADQRDDFDRNRDIAGALIFVRQAAKGLVIGFDDGEKPGKSSLRHTWASHAVMNGVPLLVVAKNLGHADTRMVEKHYGHLAPSYIADAIRAGAPRFGMVESSGLRVLR